MLLPERERGAGGSGGRRPFVVLPPMDPLPEPPADDAVLKEEASVES